jgi:hypothetical protein
VLRELAVAGEESRAVFQGVVGPDGFRWQCERALQEARTPSTEVVTHAYTDGGAYVKYAQLLSEVGGTAVPSVVHCGVFPVHEMHALVQRVLRQAASVSLAQHSNTQQLLKTLQTTTAPVHLVVFSGNGLSFAEARAHMQRALCEPAACAKLQRAMGAFVHGLSLVLKAGHVHGCVDAQTLRITQNMRICLHGWALPKPDGHSGMTTVCAWYTATEHVPHQHPLVWMLTLCWYKWLSVQRQENPGEFFVQLSLKTTLAHMAYDSVGEPCPQELHERSWVNDLHAMLTRAPGTQPGMPWVVGVARDVKAAADAKLYPVLDRMWTNAKRVFVKAFAESHKTYRKHLKDAMKHLQAEFPHSFVLRCISARASTQHVPAECTERMLGIFFSGIANLPIEVRGDREFVCRELCRWTDLYLACRELWLVLSACPNAATQPAISALRETLGSSLQNTDTTVKRVCAVLNQEPADAEHGSTARASGVTWGADML